MLTSKQRAYLRSLANNIDTLFHVGKNGVTPELTVAIDEVLESRELVKIDVLNNCVTDIKDVADMIHERTRSELVQIIGKKIVFFRPSKTNPTIKLPRDTISS